MLPIEPIGYLPIYRCLDYKCVFVLLHENVRPITDKFSLHDRIVVGRGKLKSDGVYVQKLLGLKDAFKPYTEAQQLEVDIWETCLTIWGSPELELWYRSQPETPPELDTSDDGRARVGSDGKAMDPLIQAAARRYGLPPADTAQQAEYDEVLKNLKRKASGANGQHVNGKPKKNE